MPVRTGNLYGNPLVAGIKVRLAGDASMSAGVVTNVTEPDDNEWDVWVKFESGKIGNCQVSLNASYLRYRCSNVNLVIPLTTGELSGCKNCQMGNCLRGEEITMCLPMVETKVLISGTQKVGTVSAVDIRDNTDEFDCKLYDATVKFDDGEYRSFYCSVAFQL